MGDKKDSIRAILEGEKGDKAKNLDEEFPVSGGGGGDSSTRGWCQT